MNENISQLKNIVPVSGFTFFLLIFFNIDFFLHLSQRIPGYGAIRPTLVLVLWLSFLLYLQRAKFTDVYQTGSFKGIKRLIIYLALTFFLVRWPGSAFNNLPDFVKAACFFFFTAMVVDTEKRIKIFLFVFVACQLIRVFEPLYLNLTQGYWGDKTYIGGGEFAQRLSGAPADVVNPNGLGFIIATVIPFLYYLLWGGRLKAKLVFLILLPPLLYALILTMSRGAFLALLVVGWMIFKASNHKVAIIAAVIGALIAGWGVMTDVQKDRYLSLVSSDTAGAATVDGRLQGMLNEFELGLTRPVFGNGLGTTSETKANNGYRAQAAHNLYAELMIEIGLLGMLFFISYLRTLWTGLQKNLASVHLEGTQSNFYMRLNYALLAVFWMYAVYSINYFGLSVYYWYLLGGFVVAIGRVFKEDVKING